ncbi:uncharacterized protein V6R79_014449 [Siganus canaliculatus]
MAEPWFLFRLLLLLLVTPSVFSAVLGQDVQAAAGEDVLLSCVLDPPLDVTDQTVKWTLNGVTVHLYRDGTENPEDLQDEQFRGRTSMFHHELSRGNISLKLTNVHEEDAGFYSCSVPRLKSGVKTGNVFLTVQVSDVLGHEPVQVEVGDDVVLSCHLEPQLDVSDQTVEWRWNNRIVHRYRDGADDYQDQDQQFRGRTSMIHRELVKGDISLKVSSVRKEDAGVYSCSVPRLKSLIKEGSVSLKVGGDPLDTGVIIISVLIAVCIVITSSNMFSLIRQQIRGDPLDPVLIFFSVLGLLFIITVSTLLFLYISGDLLDPVLICFSILIAIIIVKISENGLFLINQLIRGNLLDPVIICFSIANALCGVTSEDELFSIRQRIRGERLGPVIIIRSVSVLLYIIAVSALLFLYIRGDLFETVGIITFVWGLISCITLSTVILFSMLLIYWSL